MSLCTSLCRGMALLSLALMLGGCLPSTQSQQDEEKEPHYLAGKSRVNSFDFKGAVESFEKAVSVNPRSGLAHFELGCLYEQKEADPAAAIYHYEQYLKLRPAADNAEVVKQRILTCKQELVRTVSLGPVTQSLQREFEQLVTDNKRLKEEIEKWRAYVAYLQTVTNQLAGLASASRQVASPAPTPPATRSTTLAENPQPVRSNVAPAITSTSTPTPRTHTVKPGETLATIARKYGVRVETLMSANPRAEARRLRVGQVLNIPGS